MRRLNQNLSFKSEMSVKTESSKNLEESETKGALGLSLVQKTTEKIIILVLVVAVCVRLLEPPIEDRSASNDLLLISDSFDHFENQGCFLPENAFNSSKWCVLSTCCLEWDNVINRYAKGMQHSGMKPIIMSVFFFFPFCFLIFNLTISFDNNKKMPTGNCESMEFYFIPNQPHRCEKLTIIFSLTMTRALTLTLHHTLNYIQFGRFHTQFVFALSC